MARERKNWYRRWFAEEGYLGLHLVIGFVVALAGGVFFKMIADEVLRHPGIRSLDADAQSLAAALQSPYLTSVMHFVTFFGSGWILTALSIAIGLALLFAGSHRRLYTFGAIMAGGNLLNALMKDVFHRVRPTEVIPLVTARGYSFPSGHAMGAMLFFGGLAYVLFFTMQRHPVWRVLGLFLCLAAAILVGASRVYLGVHYLSDVVAGLVAGLGWIGICVSGTEVWIRWRAGRRRE